MNQRAIAIIEPVGGHGGSDHYDYALAMGLTRNGVEVHYYTCPETTEVKYSKLHTHFTFANVWSTSNKIVRLKNLILGMRKSIRSLKKESIKIVHFQFYDLKVLNLMMLSMCKMSGLKVVVTLHDIESFHGKSNKTTQNLCFKRIDEIVVHNSICKDQLALKLKNRDIHIIAHGHYLDFFDKLPSKPRETGTPLNLLFFGQIKEVKGLEIALEAISKLGDIKEKVHLTIAGKTWHTKPETYLNLIKSLGIENNVTTRFEYIPNEELPDLFKEADLIVLPYKQIYQSGVLMMAMTLGRPCLTSNLDTFDDIITDGVNGYLFETEDSDSLANKIIEIEKNNQLDQIVKNANQMIEKKLNWDTIANKTIGVYQRLNLAK